MDRKAIEETLIRDEGRELAVYADTLGNLTVGIGHLVIAKDGLFEGDTISDERCEELFQRDLDNAIADCKRIYPAFDGFPEQAQQAIVNMMFNLGGKMEGYKHFNNLVNLQCWDDVADFLLEKFPRWYEQVGRRAMRIEIQFRSINQRVDV